MTSTELVQRSGTPLATVVDGEIVMFDPDRGTYFSLGDVGSRIWELIDAPMSIVEICDVLENEYEIDREACEAQVVAFIAQMGEVGLVTKGS